MSKLKWRQRKQKRTERAEEEAKRLRRQAPYEVVCQLGCGCCDTVLHFKSKASARAAFEKAELNSTATITDDLGVAHKGIDTFYGFRLNEEKRRGLEYLVYQLTKEKTNA